MLWLLGALVVLVPAVGRADLSRPAAVYLKAGARPWQPLPVQTEGGLIRIRLAPGQTESGRALLLINPPRWMDLNDTTPPRITALFIDGKLRRAESSLWLGRGNWQPRHVVFHVTDRENRVADSTARCRVDGRDCRLSGIVIEGLSPGFIYQLPWLDYGEHTLEFRVRDDSPQANETSLSVSWERYDPSDYALAACGATLKADSHFEGYPSLAALQDGQMKLPGDHSLNDISWASAETPEPHWVEVDLGRPRRISEVTLCWALYGGAYHTARSWEVQLPAGDGWRTIGTSPRSPEPRKLTTATFAPAVTQRLRVYQPAGAGPPGRPNLMWLAEIMVR